MKLLGVSLSVLLLAVLILLGSGGFTIGKMICQGEECAPTYTLGKAKDCCGSENTSAESLSCCCELIDVSYSLDEFSVSEKVNVSAQELYSSSSLFAHAFHLPSFLLPFPSVDPSPPSAREYLHFLGSLLL